MKIFCKLKKIIIFFGGKFESRNGDERTKTEIRRKQECLLFNALGGFLILVRFFRYVSLALRFSYLKSH